MINRLVASTNHEPNIVAYMALLSVGYPKITNELEDVVNILICSTNITPHTWGVNGAMTWEVNGSTS